MHFLLVAFPSAVTLRKIYKVMDICGYLASSSADWLVFSPSFALWIYLPLPGTSLKHQSC